MSDMETHFGKAKRIGFKNSKLTFGKKLGLLKDLGYEFDYDIVDNYFESEKLIYVPSSGNFYELFEHERIDSDGFCKMTENTDGSLTFGTSFYNGGVGFDEVMIDMFEEIEKPKSRKERKKSG